VNMKIAIVTFGFSDLSLCLVKYLSKIAEVDIYFVLAENRLTESIISLEDTGVKSGFIDDDLFDRVAGCKLREYGGDHVRYHIVVYKNMKFRNMNNMILSYTLSKMLKMRRYDCIHFNGIDFQELWISLFTIGIEKVFTIHDYVGHIGERGKLAEGLNRILVASRWQKIVHSEYVERSLGKRRGSVNVVRFGPLDVYRTWSKGDVREEQKTVLFFGRFGQYKGIEYLLGAISEIEKRVGNLKVVIAGSGVQYFDIGKLKNSNTVNIINRHIRADEVAKLLQKCSLVVCPYTEATQSGVVMTAYAFGKPVVATRVGGIPEVVEENETGRLVPARDSFALAEAVAELLSNPGKREYMKKNIEKRCREGALSWPYLAGETVKVYERAIRRKRHA
jgi:glycosyltransferase involved in cell wall biosynthesis